MKNRNTKDVAENHIYPFILSNFVLIVAIFFSLNSATEAAILLYSIVINLFSNWLVFYSSQKKKLAHLSEYYNNLIIGVFCIAAILPVFAMIVPIVFFPTISHSLLLFISWILALLLKVILIKNYSWETKVEHYLTIYRMNNEEKKEKAFEDLKTFIDQTGSTKFAKYTDKVQIFDKRIQEYLNTHNNI